MASRDAARRAPRFDVTPPPVRLVGGGARRPLHELRRDGRSGGLRRRAGARARAARPPAGRLLGRVPARRRRPSGGVTGTGTARLETNQFPLLAVARAGVAAARRARRRAGGRRRVVLGMGARHRQPGRADRWSTRAIVQRARRSAAAPRSTYPLQPGRAGPRASATSGSISGGRRAGDRDRAATAPGSSPISATK